MAPLEGSSLTRSFLPVGLPSVSGQKLPSTASPGLELLPPSSFMPHGVGDTVRVSSPLGCHSLSFVVLPTLPTLLSRIPWSLNRLGCPAHQASNTAVASLLTPQPLRNVLTGQPEPPYGQAPSRTSGLGGQVEAWSGEEGKIERLL